MKITINLTEDEAVHFREYKHDVNINCEKVNAIIKKIEKEVDKLKLK